MIAYARCNSCGVQWSIESNRISIKGCTVCGKSGHQLSIGNKKPDWYTGGSPSQEPIQKRWWEFWK